MALKKLTLRPGVNRENTRYTSENGWYEGDKIRFRQGTPEKIGGWIRTSANKFLGICRSLWGWVSGVSAYLGIGTNLKFYIERGGEYNDITPLRATVTLIGAFSGTGGQSEVLVSDPAGGFVNGDFITISGASATGGITLNGEFQITILPTYALNTYTFLVRQQATMGLDYRTFTFPSALANGVRVSLSTDAGGLLPTGFSDTLYYVVNATSTTFQLSLTLGGPAITATSFGVGYLYATPRFNGTFTSGGGTAAVAYQVNVGSAIQLQTSGWGAGGWGLGEWGVGATTSNPLRIWTQANFGADLLFGPIGKGVYYWNAASGLGVRGVALASQGGTITATTTTTPSSFTLQYAYTDGTAVQVAATGALPTGLTAGVTYYIQNVEGLTCNLSADRGGASLITVSSLGSGVYISSLEDVPKVQNYLLVSDTSRFVFVFGTNDYGLSVQNPMLVRWSDQESATIWYPQTTNQAGSVLLSRGSQLVTALQARQEIVVWTDSSLYSFQYVGAPVVWKNELIGDNISIAGPNAVGYANGAVFWMGVDKFYVYDGRTQTLPCDLRQFVFTDVDTRVNQEQIQQVCCGTNEGFNEVWWFYPSGTSTTIDTYVVYNYVEKVWYYGSMARTAWLDTGLRPTPVAATYLNNLVNHEVGVDDVSTGVPQPIEAYVSSAEFDIDDGYKVGFVWRMLPDITFRGSTANNPSVTMKLLPMQNSGSGYNNPASVGGINTAPVTRSSTVVIEQFTGQINTRVRGRQMVMEVRSTDLGVQWQLGSPRLDIRPDGRR